MFGAFLQKIKKFHTTKCILCEEVYDDAEHTLFRCEGVAELRIALTREYGAIDASNFINKIRDTGETNERNRSILEKSNLAPGRHGKKMERVEERIEEEAISVADTHENFMQREPSSKQCPQRRCRGGNTGVYSAR